MATEQSERAEVKHAVYNIAGDVELRALAMSLQTCGCHFK